MNRVTDINRVRLVKMLAARSTGDLKQLHNELLEDLKGAVGRLSAERLNLETKKTEIVLSVIKTILDERGNK